MNAFWLLVLLLADCRQRPLSTQDIVSRTYNDDVLYRCSAHHFNLLCCPVAPLLQPTLDGVGANWAIIILFICGALAIPLEVLERKCSPHCRAAIDVVYDFWSSFPPLLKKGLSLLLILYAARVIGMLLIMSGDVEQNPGPPKKEPGSEDVIEAQTKEAEEYERNQEQELDNGDFISVLSFLVGLDDSVMFNLGLELGLTRQRLQTFQKESSTFGPDVIEAWLQKQDDVKIPTWDSLVIALTSIHQNEIAAHVKDIMKEPKVQPKTLSSLPYKDYVETFHNLMADKWSVSDCVIDAIGEVRSKEDDSGNIVGVALSMKVVMVLQEQEVRPSLAILVKSKDGTDKLLKPLCESIIAAIRMKFGGIEHDYVPETDKGEEPHWLRFSEHSCE